MSGFAPPASSTDQLAAALPGSDPAPVINASEQRLADYLNRPAQQILDEFGLHRHPGQTSGAPASQALPANPGAAMSPINPSSLISPVLNALGTLGNGQFSGADPQKMFTDISKTLESSAAQVQQTLAALEHGWQGKASTSAATKTAAALANGTDLTKQAAALRASLATAAADVAHARTQLIEIINEFMATLAAIGPNIIFPWGWAAVLAAAAKAVVHTTTVMTTLQSSLAAQASAVTAIGEKIVVTAAPTLGTSPGAATSAASAMSTMGLLSPLISLPLMGISPLMSLASMAGNSAASSAAGPATLAGATGGDPADPKSHAADAAGKSGAAASGAGGAGRGAVSGALASRLSAPMSPAAPQTASTAVPAGSTRPAMGAAAMGGAPMMGGGAPLGGAGHAGGAGGAHTAASFLHTTDQGGKVVKDGGTVAPPVIGEADPHETPDIELRI
jgi:hypothetical protein